jgi:hypothetical protein
MKHQHISLALIVIAALTIGGLSINTISQLSAASHSSTNIPISFTIISSDFDLSNIYVNGENKHDATTYNATNMIEFDAMGPGKITLVDLSGHEYYTATKTTIGQAHYLVRFDLTGVGTHELILRMESGDDQIEARISLNYRALPLPPNTGVDLQNETNYTYVGGYAINNVDVMLLAVILTVVAVIVFLLVHQHQDEKLPVSRHPRRPQTRVLKPKAAPKPARSPKSRQPIKQK